MNVYISWSKFTLFLAHFEKEPTNVYLNSFVNSKYIFLFGKNLFELTLGSDFFFMHIK